MSSSLSLPGPSAAVSPSGGSAAAAAGPTVAAVSGVTSFLSAFSALHHHPDSAVKAEANRWLMSFQASREAWQVSDAVLHSPQLSDEVYYNAANILRQKLMHSYHELPGQTAQPAIAVCLSHSLTHLRAQPSPAQPSSIPHP